MSFCFYNLDDIADCDQCYLSLVCLSQSVYLLLRSYIVPKWPNVSPLFLLHTTFPFLSQFVLKSGLHRSTPSSHNLSPKWPTSDNLSTPSSHNLSPKWPTSDNLSVRRHSMVKRYCNGHIGEPIENHHRCFEWYHRWPPTTAASL